MKGLNHMARTSSNDTVISGSKNELTQELFKLCISTEPSSVETVRVAESLIDAGANVHEILTGRDEYGENVLMAAIRFFNYPMAKMLVQRGSPVNERNRNGSTPLRRVIAEAPENENGFDLLQTLLEAGASMKTKDQSQITPYEAAVKYRKFKFVAMMDSYKERQVLSQEVSSIKSPTEIIARPHSL